MSVQKSVFECGVSRTVAKRKMHTLTRSAQSEDWDEDIRQMELDNAREAMRPEELMLDLFNPLSLPMKQFWNDPDDTMPEPIEMPSPSPEPVASPEAMLEDLPQDELMPSPEVRPVAGMSAPRPVQYEHEEGLSRFQRFSRALRSSVRDTRNAVFTRPPLEPPTHDSNRD